MSYTYSTYIFFGGNMFNKIKKFLKDLLEKRHCNKLNEIIVCDGEELNDVCLDYIEHVINHSILADVLCSKFFDYFDDGLSVSYNYAYNNIVNYINMDVFLTPFLNAYRKITNDSRMHEFLNELKNLYFDEFLANVSVADKDNSDNLIPAIEWFEKRITKKKLSSTYIESIFFSYLWKHSINYVNNSTERKIKFLKNDADLFYTRNISNISYRASVYRHLCDSITDMRNAVVNNELDSNNKDYYKTEIINILNESNYTQNGAKLVKFIKDNSSEMFVNVICGNKDSCDPEYLKTFDEFMCELAKTTSLLESQIDTLFKYDFVSRMNERLCETPLELTLSTYNVDVYWRKDE